MKIAVAVSVAAITAADFAHSATITVESRGDQQPALVLVDGTFESGDGDQFRIKASPLSSKAVVSFRSDGGDVVAAIQIGELIRLKGFTTAVAGNSECASACALAWLGGTKRLMNAESKIGFHAAHNRVTGKETGSGNALIGAYLNKLGLPYPAVFYITKASPESITWLSMKDAAKYGIDVQLADAKSMPEWRPATDPMPAVVMPLKPTRTPTTGAMAVGIAGRGVAWGYATGFAINQPSENAARSNAVEQCRRMKNSNDDARSRCEVVAIFHNKCVASAIDPNAGTAGAGWGLSSSQREADNQALEQCRATAGYDRAQFCAITDRYCDGGGK